jgi:hypothetical protein
MKNKTLLSLLLGLSIWITACNFTPGGTAAVPDTNALSTQIAATVNAALNLAKPTSPPTSVPTSAPIVPTPAPTNAPVVATKAPVPNGSGSFSPITFAIGQNNEQPVDALASFPGGVTMMYAIFSGVNMKDGDTWRNEWYYNGTLQDKLSQTSTWDAATAGANNVWWLTVYNPDGVRSGQWELKLYVGTNLVQSGQITVEANVEPGFGPITFAAGVDKSDKPVGLVDVSDPTFPVTTTEVYAFFNGINVPKDTAWQTQWFLNDAPQDSKDHTWSFAPTEQDWLQFGSTGSSPLAPGTYELKLSINGTVVNIGSFVVAAK